MAVVNTHSCLINPPNYLIATSCTVNKQMTKYNISFICFFICFGNTKGADICWYLAVGKRLLCIDNTVLVPDLRLEANHLSTLRPALTRSGQSLSTQSAITVKLQVFVQRELFDSCQCSVLRGPTGRVSTIKHYCVQKLLLSPRLIISVSVTNTSQLKPLD